MDRLKYSQAYTYTLEGSMDRLRDYRGDKTEATWYRLREYIGDKTEAAWYRLRDYMGDKQRRLGTALGNTLEINRGGLVPPY